MSILQIEIVNPDAEKLLYDLAEMDLIHISPTQNNMEKFVPNHRQAGWGKDIIATVLPSFDEPLEEFQEYV